MNLWDRAKNIYRAKKVDVNEDNHYDIDALLEDDADTLSRQIAALQNVPQHIVQAFQELQIPYTRNADTIRDAYRIRLKQVHPDTNKGADASANTDKLIKAYNTIMDYLNGK